MENPNMYMKSLNEIRESIMELTLKTCEMNLKLTNILMEGIRQNKKLDQLHDQLKSLNKKIKNCYGIDNQ